MERSSLVGDLAGSVGAPDPGLLDPVSRQLVEIEAEHEALCERRRRLHESIDLLTGLDAIKPDAAARLERYRATEESVSRRRAELYRLIRELRGAQALRSEQS